jgi:hypothetical protein
MSFLSELLPGHVGGHDVRYIRQPEGGVMCASTSKLCRSVAGIAQLRVVVP